MFSHLVVCCLALSIASCAQLPDATAENEFTQWSGRIVGGRNAQLGQFPYQVSMRSTQNSHFCGGFILTNRWIGSAAHCTAPRSTSNTVVAVGAISRSSGTTYQLQRMINHPNFQSSTLANDISLVQTTRIIMFNNFVQPIAVGSQYIGAGVNAVATGYGQTSRSGPNSNGLLFVALRTIDNDDCRRRFSAVNAKRVFNDTICTFTRSGEGTCMGDSGGPLVAGGNVIGAVSWGIPCANGSPDVYARISSHRSWIMNHIMG